MCLAPAPPREKRTLCRLWPAAGLAAALALALAGCGTPRERCVEDASFEVRRLALMAQDSRTALARGYRWREEVSWQQVHLPCDGLRSEFGHTHCGGAEEVVRGIPVPVDPVSEARVLAGLEARLAEARAARAAAAARCAARHPR